MSSEHETDSDLVALLLRAAGRREEPPVEVYNQTLEVAADAWRTKVVSRRRRRALIALSAAACILATLAGSLFAYRTLQTDEAVLAQVERVIGLAHMRPASREEWVSVRDRLMPLRDGAHFRTGGNGRAGILLNHGASVRLAEHTEIVFEGPARIRLVAGRVYLDNGSSAAGASPIEIETPAGVASDVGTQFEVSYVDTVYRVRVREGRVHIEHGTGAIETAAGEEVWIDAAGRVSRGRIAPDHEDWQWVETLSPAPNLEGQPVSVLLAWIARETGRAVRFETPEVERKARTTILHGEIHALAPLEALEVMLRTTDLAHTVLDDGTIVIRPRSSG
jgi:ferric-dicitrate binding protein FerR (iron transport regulator)